MKKISIVFFFIIGFIYNGQSQLNEYKYIIVPTKFENFKKENQYQTSTLLKHLFVNEGFKAVYSNKLPKELANNMCLALVVDIVDDSNMFSTKSSLVLKDCTFKEVFKTQEGKSRSKDYKSAYEEAISASFTSIKELDYKYQPKDKEETITISFKNDVKTLEKEVIPTVAENDKQKQLVKDQESKVAEVIGKKAEITVLETTDVLYAQKIANGYQLVDNKPSIKLKMFNSSIENYYIVEAIDQGSGIAYMKDGKWFYEYYKESELQVEELVIKF